MKIFFIRHGETDKNVGRNLHEKGDSETLNQTGVEQIEKTAEILRNAKISVIFCSKETRAQKSSEILSNILECPTIQIDGFEERNWGVYSNRPWSDVKEVLDPLTLEERYTYVPPEGESWEIFEKRLIEALTESIKKGDDENIGIVTHGGAIRALIPYLLGVSKEESFKYDPANASITEFDYDGKIFTRQRIDDTSHLLNK
ncbi:histidine phosphatase family protein [bacterium]|nr:histidine phosphatase family protein [bacterium]